MKLRQHMIQATQILVLILLSSVFVSAYDIEISQRYDGSFTHKIISNDGQISVYILTQNEVAGLIELLEVQKITPKIVITNVVSITNNKLLIQESIQQAINNAQKNNKLIAKPITISYESSVSTKPELKNDVEKPALKVSKSSNPITGSAIQDVPAGNWNFIVGIMALLSLVVFGVVKRKKF